MIVKHWVPSNRTVMINGIAVPEEPKHVPMNWQCPNCERTVARMYDCKCGMMFHIDESNDHVIYSRYRDGQLDCFIPKMRDVGIIRFSLWMKYQ